MSFFDHLINIPLVVEEFVHRNYIDLTVGAYRTDQNLPFVFPVVQRAKVEYAENPFNCHDYLPILGHEGFCKAATELVLGKDSPAILDGKSFGIQCLSETGALRSGAEFLSQVLKFKTVYFCKPSLSHHKNIFKKAGFTSINTFSYWNFSKKQVDIENMIADLEGAPEKAVVVLPGCAHNPTGVDPTRDQWKRIAEVIKRKELFTFFDFPYQGLASGDTDVDAWAIRHFVQEGLEMFVAQSCAMNFGLYSELVGNLVVVMNKTEPAFNFLSQMTLISVSKFSNPPAFGASIVCKILSTPELREEWLSEVRGMHLRLKHQRQSMVRMFRELKTPGSWEHISQQVGVFNYIGLTINQIRHLIKHHNIKLFRNGSFAICGLNSQNIESVVKAIDETVCRTI